MSSNKPASVIRSQPCGSLFWVIILPSQLSIFLESSEGRVTAFFAVTLRLIHALALKNWDRSGYPPMGSRCPLELNTQRTPHSGHSYARISNCENSRVLHTQFGHRGAAIFSSLPTMSAIELLLFQCAIPSLQL
jgi:hypothetical protein